MSNQLTKNEKDLLYSLALGDGCIYATKDRSRYSLSIGHGPKQKDYCEWKMNLLNDSNIFPKKARLRRQEIHDSRNGKTYIQYLFTKGSKLFKSIWEDYHAEDRIKRILQNIHSDRSLAIWFMDDGATEKHKRKYADGIEYWSRPSFHLCTHCFTEQENEYIAQWFKRRYLIDAYVSHSSRGDVQYSFLRFSTDSTEKIYSIIRPYVLQIESMREKFKYTENYYYPNK